jgi:hypothetical protein
VERMIANALVKADGNTEAPVQPRMQSAGT